MAKIRVKEYFVYRLNFLILRLRVFLSFLLIWFFWQAVYKERVVINGWGRAEIMSYIFLVQLIIQLVNFSSLDDLGPLILNGQLVNLLLRPVSLIKTFAIWGVVGNFIDLSFSVLELSFLYFIFRPSFHVVFSYGNLVLFVLSLLFSIWISFWLAFILSSFAFWTNQIWAIRFFYMMISNVLAGGYFPLSILPGWFYNLVYLTPFPYLYYLPSLFLIKGGGLQEVFPMLIGMAAWSVVIYFLARLLWIKGLRSYAAYGG